MDIDNFIDEPQNFSRVIFNLFPNVKTDELEKSMKMLNMWQSVLSGIDSRSCNTANMAEHSRVVDLKHGVLLVEVDHPGWIQMIQLHKRNIIKTLSKKLPELSVTTLAFRVKGSSVSLAEIGAMYPSEQQKKDAVLERLNKEEKLLEKFDSARNSTLSSSEENSRNLPPELQKKLDELKNDMLTNSKN